MTRYDNVMRSFLRYEEETEHRVRHGIELYRKGFGRITVKDRDGNPITGVKIRAKLKKHEFLHGANIFMLGEFEQDESNARYSEAFRDCFNEATVPIYWDGLEPEDGKPRFSKDSPSVYRRPPLDLCVEYCEANNITPKAHCLTYFNFNPAWVNEFDIPALKRRIDRRYRELAERYADRIPAWEVINETLCTSGGRNRDKTPYFQDDRIVEDSFELAHKYFPYNELIINEASHIWEPNSRQFSYNRSDYYQLSERAMRNGARIDCIGMQFHAFKRDEAEAQYIHSLYNPKNIYRVLDCYAKLGKPIQITEITIPAYRETVEDYALQAEILERLYRIWFSHPAVEAAIYWNLPDGYAAFAPKGDMGRGENYYRAGLLDFNLNAKPAYEMLRHLFHEEWTTDTICESDAMGEALFHGFFGEYELTIGDVVKTIKLSSKFANEFEIVL